LGKILNKIKLIKKILIKNNELFQLIKINLIKILKNLKFHINLLNNSQKIKTINLKNQHHLLNYILGNNSIIKIKIC